MSTLLWTQLKGSLRSDRSIESAVVGDNPLPPCNNQTALIIGMINFQDHTVPSIRHSKSNCDAMRAILHRLGYTKVTVITDPVRSTVVKTLTQETPFMVYVSSHSTKGHGGIHVPLADYADNNPSGNLSLTDLTSLGLHKSGHRCVIVDGVHAGTRKRFPMNSFEDTGGRLMPNFSSLLISPVQYPEGQSFTLRLCHAMLDLAGRGYAMTPERLAHLMGDNATLIPNNQQQQGHAVTIAHGAAIKDSIQSMVGLHVAISTEDLDTQIAKIFLLFQRCAPAVKVQNSPSFDRTQSFVIAVDGLPPVRGAGEETSLCRGLFEAYCNVVKLPQATVVKAQEGRVYATVPAEHFQLYRNVVQKKAPFGSSPTNASVNYFGVLFTFSVTCSFRDYLVLDALGRLHVPEPDSRMRVEELTTPIIGPGKWTGPAAPPKAPTPAPAPLQRSEVYTSPIVPAKPSWAEGEGRIAAHDDAILSLQQRVLLLESRLSSMEGRNNERQSDRMAVFTKMHEELAQRNNDLQMKYDALWNQVTALMKVKDGHLREQKSQAAPQQPVLDLEEVMNHFTIHCASFASVKDVNEAFRRNQENIRAIQEELVLRTNRLETLSTQATHLNGNRIEALENAFRALKEDSMMSSRQVLHKDRDVLDVVDGFKESLRGTRMDFAEVKQNVEKLWHVVSTPDALFDKFERRFQGTVNLIVQEQLARFKEKLHGSDSLPSSPRHHLPEPREKPLIDAEAFIRFCTQLQQLQTKVNVQERVNGELKHQLSLAAQKHGETLQLLAKGVHDGSTDYKKAVEVLTSRLSVVEEYMLNDGMGLQKFNDRMADISTRMTNVQTDTNNRLIAFQAEVTKLSSTHFHILEDLKDLQHKYETYTMKTTDLIQRTTTEMLSHQNQKLALLESQMQSKITVDMQRAKTELVEAMNTKFDNGQESINAKLSVEVNRLERNIGSVDRTKEVQDALQNFASRIQLLENSLPETVALAKDEVLRQVKLQGQNIQDCSNRVASVLKDMATHEQIVRNQSDDVSKIGAVMEVIKQVQKTVTQVKDKTGTMEESVAVLDTRLTSIEALNAANSIGARRANIPVDMSMSSLPDFSATLDSGISQSKRRLARMESGK